MLAIQELLASRLGASFYERDTVTIAKELPGKILIRYDSKPIAGLIVETEAYPGGEDVASHHHHGKLTNRTKIIFGPKGKAYVYCVHNKYCFGVICGHQNHHGVAFIRAIEPILGMKSIKHGPSFVTQTFDINKKDYGADLLTGKLTICDNPFRETYNIDCAERIGIARDKPYGRELWRFYIKDRIRKEYIVGQL